MLEPIFEEDAIKARLLAKMKDEANLEMDLEKGIDDRRGDVTVE